MLTFSRSGMEKSMDIIFDADLNMGRLYTVKNGSASYIVTILDENTVLLNIGLNEAQWVFCRET